MKIVCFSDTHSRHRSVQIPDGDVLVFSGDLTDLGKEEEIIKFNDFIGYLPHKYKIIIAGNHDFLFENNPKKAQSLITNAIYLQDSDIEINGILFYGSPWQPWFFDWAFNIKEPQDLKKKWDKIPENTDVLITHGPPYGHGDTTIRGDLAGCKELLSAIQRIQPKYHIFGHIHEGYGITKEGNTTCVNASTCNIQYRPKNPPFVFEL